MINHDIVSVGLRKRGEVYVANIRYKIGDVTAVKRLSLKTKNYRIAKAKIENFNKTLHDPLHKNCLSDLLEEYVARCASRSRKSNHIRRISLLRQIFGVKYDALNYRIEGLAEKSIKTTKPLLDVTYIQDINSALIEKFFTNCSMFAGLNPNGEETGIGPTTLNRYREEIRAFINWAMETMKVKMPAGANPVKVIKKFKEVVLPIIYLERSKIAQQLFKIRRDVMLQTMIAVMIFAGLRREELLLLQCHDICLVNMNIKVLAKEFKGGVWVPKNKKPRVVPISKRLAKYLQRYVKELDKGSLWFFPGNNGNPWVPDTFSTYLKESNAAVNLSWTCNEYRHTFGSHLAKKNVSLFKISELMGNSPEICRKHYACLVPTEMHKDVEF